jgi:hypothetical protein
MIYKVQLVQNVVLVKKSALAATCNLLESRGLSFTATSTDPDPLGSITLRTKDPRLAHERAGSTFMNELHLSLVRIGLRRSFFMSGNATWPMGPLVVIRSRMGA